MWEESEMAIDRQGTGLAVVRIAIGVFFLAEGLSKYRWFTDSSMLASQLSGWLQNAQPGSLPARLRRDRHRTGSILELSSPC